MKIFPKKRVKVAEGLHVWISNHFYYNDFGIRDAGEAHYSGRRFVLTGAPGTGFIERESESHSYHLFVRKHLARQKNSYTNLLFGREPNFEKSLAAANKALEQCTDKRKRDFIDCYVNALTVAAKEERMERVVRGIKDKMGHHSNKFMVSVMSHYKNKMRQLEHDIISVIYHVKDHCSPETYAAYEKVVDLFTHVASCRRVWYYDPMRRDSYSQVFFDLGVFDYIRSEKFLPLMRDPNGVCYYLLPDCMIVARGSLDFDVVPLKDLTVVSQELAIEEPNEALLGQMGDAASMIKIPEFNLNCYFTHVRVVVDLVRALDQLKATL